MTTHLIFFAKLHLLFGAVGAAVLHAAVQDLALAGRGAPVGSCVGGELLVKRLQNLKWQNRRSQFKIIQMKMFGCSHLSLVPFGADILEDNSARG